MSETLVEYEIHNEEAVAIADTVKSFVIKTQDDFAKTAEWVSILKNQIKNIDRFFEEDIENTNKAHKALCKKRNDAKEPWMELLQKVSHIRSDYQVEQERIRLEAQRKAEAEAREVARKEQEALLARAAAAKTVAKQEELLDKAENVYIEPVIVPSVVDKKIELSFGGSVSSQKDIDVIVTDVKAICKAVADGKLPVGIIEIKNNALKTFAKLQSLKNGDIDGFVIKATFRDINRK